METAPLVPVYPPLLVSALSRSLIEDLSAVVTSTFPQTSVRSRLTVCQSSASVLGFRAPHPQSGASHCPTWSPGETHPPRQFLWVLLTRHIYSTDSACSGQPQSLPNLAPLRAARTPHYLSPKFLYHSWHDYRPLLRSKVLRPLRSRVFTCSPPPHSPWPALQPRFHPQLWTQISLPPGALD